MPLSLLFFFALLLLFVSLAFPSVPPIMLPCLCLTFPCVCSSGGWCTWWRFWCWFWQCSVSRSTPTTSPGSGTACDPASSVPWRATASSPPFTGSGSTEASALPWSRWGRSKRWTGYTTLSSCLCSCLTCDIIMQVQMLAIILFQYFFFHFKEFQECYWLS